MGFKLDSTCGNVFSRWVRRLEHRALLIAILATLLGAACLLYTLDNLRIDTNLDNMVADDLPFQRTQARVKAQFPQIFNNVVVVLDSDAAESARTAALALREALSPRGDLFEHVDTPRADPFFENKALLYQTEDKLEEMSLRLADVQPFLGTLRRDHSMRGLFSTLEVAFEEKTKGDELEIGRVVGNIDNAIQATLKDEPYVVSWRELLMDEEYRTDDRRQYVMAKPRLDPTRALPAKDAIAVVRAAWQNLPEEKKHGVQMHLTGGATLSHEELEAVLGDMILIGILLTVLVGVVLTIGLGSWQLVVSTILTLSIGLTYTGAMATALVGRLNVVSVAFGILYVGLSVDYAIHICLRYREGIQKGLIHIDALCAAVRYTGGALVIATITTAIGFYAFVPTSYAGIAELGIISGTGMFISLFSNVTVLPAFLALLPMPAKPQRQKGLLARKSLRDLPERHPRPVLLCSAVVLLISLVLLPRVHFDPNPLNLRDPDSESVITFRRLLATSRPPPWTLNVLAESESQAAHKAQELRDLPAVWQSRSLVDLVPDNQEEKLGILEDTALSIGAGFPVEPDPPPSLDEQAAAVRSASKAIDAYLASEHGRNDAGARELRGHMDQLASALAKPDGKGVAERFERAAIGTLPESMELLDNALTAEGFTQEDIPERLKELWVSNEGVYRVEAYPGDDLNDLGALQGYASEVETVAPDAAGTPVQMLGTRDTVVSAFREAIMLAVIASFVVLLILLRDLKDVGLVLTPLLMAGILTGGAMVILGLDFNFANVVALPMLFGLGIDNGVHMVHRAREHPPGSPTRTSLLGTSTARGIIFSALTTGCSFGSLALSRHAGMASMGSLLTIGMLMTLISTLVTLPALLTVTGTGSPAPKETDGQAAPAPGQA